MTESIVLPENPRITVIGSGAIGGYYGGRLAEHGHDVHFLARSDYVSLKQNGLVIHSPDGDARFPVSCADKPEDIGPCDLIVIALKATANDSLRSILPPLMHSSSLLLTLQNGLGSDELLARQFGMERVLGGLCFVCINRTAPGIIEHLAQGRISLGEFAGSPQARTHRIAEMFRSSKVECAVAENLAAARWSKLVWNIPFNGLSIAAGGVDTASILADEGLRQLVRDLMGEVISAAAAYGHDIPRSLIDSMIGNTQAMRAYQTSSLLDFLAHREVEIEAIWGEPLRRAQAAGVEVPRLGMLYALLRHLTARPYEQPCAK